MAGDRATRTPMHKLKTCLTIALAVYAALFGLPAAAPQTTVGSNLQFVWTTNTTTSTGQLGNYVILNGTTAPRPGNYAVSWTDAGTAPSACTFHAQGSSDNVTWFPLDGGTAVTCTASGNEFVVTSPVLYLRINLVTFTRGDATTVLKFYYTGGRS